MSDVIYWHKLEESYREVSNSLSHFVFICCVLIAGIL